MTAAGRWSAYTRPAALAGQDELSLPRGLASAPVPGPAARLRPELARVVAAPAQPVRPDGPRFADGAGSGESGPRPGHPVGDSWPPVRTEGLGQAPDAGPVGDRRAPAGRGHPAGAARRRKPRTGCPGCPATPVVNRRALELYLWTPLTTDEIESWGMPSADLFLLAGQDPLRLSDRRRDGYLLRVQAPEETAVELVEHLGDAPAAMRDRLSGAGNTHLLPLRWLSELRVTARFDLDGRGGIATRNDLDPAALAIRFEGAGHGVPGLPNEVVAWPDKGDRAGTPSYLMLPEEPGRDARADRRGFVALSRRKPTLAAGHQIFEVKVRKRKAIDVPATLDQLGGVPVVGRMHDFVGLDLLIPVDDLDQALVAKVWRPGPTGRPMVERLTGATLLDTLAA